MLSGPDKAAKYDWLVREIRARQPSIERLLGHRTHHYKGERHQEALLRAFDLAVDELKRRQLAEQRPDTPARRRPAPSTVD